MRSRDLARRRGASRGARADGARPRCAPTRTDKVAIGRGLSLATGAPCIGVTSLEAAQPAGQQGSAIVALAAQKRPPDITFWAQTFRSGMATAIANEMRADELVQLMSDRPHLLFGDQDALSRCFPNDSIHAAAPSAARAAAVAAELDPDQRPARPTYARSPDAALPASKPKK